MAASKPKKKQQQRTKRSRKSQHVTSIDIRKSLLLDTIEDQSRRITRQKVSHAKEKISRLSARELRMIQRNENNAATSTVTNDSTKNKYNDEELDSVVPTVVETPTKESINLPSSPSQSKSVTNPPTRQIRHASKAALEAIGKIARFERALKEKLSDTLELDENSISLSCSSGNNGSAYISRKSSAMQTNNTTNSTNDIENTFEITKPQLPDMIKNHLFGLVDDDTITEQSYTNHNDSYDDLVARDHRNKMNSSPGSKSLTIVADSQYNHCSKSSTHLTKMKQAQSSKIKKMEDITKYFKLPKTILSSIASEEQRRTDENIMQSNPRGWLGMTNMIQMCTNQMMDIICPGPSRPYFRKTLAQKLMNEHVQAGQRRIKTTVQQFDQLLSVIFNIMNASKKGSAPKKITRAILCAGVPRTNTLRKACEQFGSSYISTGTTRMEALVDYDKLASGQFMDERKICSRKRKSDTIVENAVKFLLHPDNVRTFSWGTTTKHLSNHETIVLPKLQRTMTRTNLWIQYQEYALRNKLDRIRRTTFFNICNEITYSEEVLLGSVDYVQALLLTEPIELLQTVIDKYFIGEKHKEMSSSLLSLSQFLKNTYRNHVLMEDDCCTHGIEYGLGRQDSNYIEADEIKTSVTCIECRYPLYVCNQIQNEIIHKSAHEDDLQLKDAIAVTKCCSSKFKLYMGHQMRCANQNYGIDKIKKQMVQKLIESNGREVQALMIIDFKMKFEPISARETSLEHYGKRGIGWHGVHIMYFKLEHVEDEEDGTISEKAVQYSVYLDQILDDGNKQDTVCVVSLLDSALRQITLDIPSIRSIILQSDNANSYQNTFLICAIALLNSSYSSYQLKIITFIHTETQDGKTVLDAHFARCMRYLNHFMKSWKRNKITRINTPKGLGFALACNGGMTNVMVQVVKTNRELVCQIQQIFEPIVKIMKQYFTRVNHIEFISNSVIDIFDLTEDDKLIDFVKQFEFQIGVQAYSNVGHLATFVIDVGNKTVTPDEVVENEIKFNLNGFKESIVQQEKDLDTSSQADNDSTAFDNLLSDITTNMKDFTIESKENNDGTSFDESDDMDDYSSNDETDTEDIATSTDYVEKRIYTEPNQIHFSPNGMVMRPEIIRILQLGGARKRKIIKDNKDDTTGKMLRKRKIIDKYKNTRIDTTARAIRFAENYISTGCLLIKDGKMKDQSLMSGEGFELSNDDFKKGWARRLKVDGGIYGRTYIEDYKDDIEEYFIRGKKNSSEKMNAAQIREALVSRYPNRFSIPSETEIKQEISALFARSKDSKRQKRNKQDNIIFVNVSKAAVDWANILDDIVVSNRAEKPEIIYELFVSFMTKTHMFPLDDLPTKANVKKKIAYYKQKHRKEAMNVVV